jgi:putative transposase
MPGKATEPMPERVPFMAAYLREVYAMPERWARFGMRRNTGSQWVRRDTAEGPVGLQDKPRAPHRCPQRLSQEAEAALLQAKRAHPHWGPHKILPSRARRRPALAPPAPSPAGALCRRAGLSHARKPRRRRRHPGALPRQAEVPQAVWTADVTGQCRPGDGRSGSPLTVAEAYRRLLLSGAARRSTKEARPICERLFQESGLPAAIRTDNGAPFATPACCGLSTLAVGWITRGIRQQRMAPGRPEQQGAHERLHRTLKADATRPPERHQEAQQARFDRCCREDNEGRPHEALGDRTPASRCRPSLRPLAAKLPAPASPGHDVARRVRTAGTFRFQSRQLFSSDTLLQEAIALEETADGIWSISFDDVLLARLDERDFRLYA